MKNKLILLLALLFGLVAAAATYKYTEDLKETYKVSGNFARVAVAKQKITARTVIDEEMLSFQEMPVEYVLPGAIVDIKDAEGKITRGDIFPGEFILSNKLVGREEADAGLSAKIEQGKRAISIPVTNVTALHGLINTGDYVDVIVTATVPRREGDQRGQEEETVTSTIIQNVPVLAINKDLVTNDGIKEEPQTVTLMVRQEEAQQIALALQQGAIQLSLRAPGDDSIIQVPSTKIEQLTR
jgi:pilus assembly protein CpaB